jgi:nucleotide-binding universal stress UspA family protein
MHRILVAVDGSEAARHAVRLAAEVGAPLGASLTLAHVVDAVPVLPGDEAESLATQEEAQVLLGRELLEGLLAHVRRPGLAVQGQLLHGAPAQTLARLAKEERYDLVVVGSKGRNVLSRMLVGSVTDHLVQACEAPVLVARGRSH